MDLRVHQAKGCQGRDCAPSLWLSFDQALHVLSMLHLASFSALPISLPEQIIRSGNRKLQGNLEVQLYSLASLDGLVWE